MVDALKGGSRKDKRIAELEACVEQQSEQISVQKQLIQLLNMQLQQATSGLAAASGGSNLIGHAGGGVASEVRQAAVGEKRPAAAVRRSLLAPRDLRSFNS